MQITRRDFLKYVGASAAAMGLSRYDLARVEEALAAPGGPPVIWLSGAACTGCSVSLLNAVTPTVDQLLLNTINLKYHATLMAASGDLAVSAATSTAAAGSHILVVEGAIPTGEAGRYCYVWDQGGHSVTMAEAVSSLAGNASLVVAVGTCAAFGGIPSHYCGTQVKGLRAFLGRAVVNLPGCPTHPDWIMGTLASVLAGATPSLDGNGRPLTYYTARVIHERCPRREREEASRFGQPGLCLEELGCRGPSSHADCDRRGWNNNQNWCIGADGLCIGCTEPGFPAFPLHRSEEDHEADSLAIPNASCVLNDTSPSGDLNHQLFLPEALNE